MIAKFAMQMKLGNLAHNEFENHCQVMTGIKNLNIQILNCRYSLFGENHMMLNRYLFRLFESLTNVCLAVQILSNIYYFLPYT